MILPKDAKEVTITSTDYKMTMIHPAMPCSL